MGQMKKMLIAIQVFVVVLISLLSGYALLDKLFFIPAGGLLAVGILSLIFPRLLHVIFGVLAVVATFPALMKLNSVKWWLFTPERLAFCPGFSLPAAVAVSLPIICGSLILGLLHTTRRELAEIRQSGAGENQVQAFAGGQATMNALMVLSCGVASAIIVLLLWVVQVGLSGVFRQTPWIMPVIGIVSLAVLGLVIFWIAGSPGMSGRKNP
jgi:hypothetical protein